MAEAGTAVSRTRPFRLIVVLTDGRISKRFLVLTWRPDGIYLATLDERYGALHTSYHQDGTFHFRAPRVPGPDPPSIKRPAFTEVRGFFQLHFASFGTTRPQLERLSDLQAEDRPERLVPVDLHQLPGRLSCSVFILEPGYDGPPPPKLGNLIHEALISETMPWILLHVYAGPP